MIKDRKSHKLEKNMPNVNGANARQAPAFTDVLGSIIFWGLLIVPGLLVIVFEDIYIWQQV